MSKYLLGLSVVVLVAVSGCFGGGGSSTTKTTSCPSYRGDLAALMVQAAAASYESDQAALQANLSAMGLTLDEHKIKDSGTGTQGFLAYNDKLVIVAFRGSEDLKDWLGNVKAWDNEVKATADCDKKVKVHQGFQDAIQSVTNSGALHQRIATLQKGGRKLYITGHSLGGALATLMTYFSNTAEPAISVDGVYTFGQPMVGNNGFSQCYEADYLEKTFRFVNHKDAVPRLNVNDNKHVGLLVFIDKNGNLKTEAPKSILDKVNDVLDTALIESHSIGEYVTDIQNQQQMNPFACVE